MPQYLSWPVVNRLDGMAAGTPVELVLAPFTTEELPIVEPWFDDPETQQWLGDRKWPAMVLHPPAEHRGHPTVRRESLLAIEDGSPVALLDVETYQDGTAGFAFVVDPGRRGRGVCRQAALALVARLAKAGVHGLFGGVEPANLASIRCLEAAGFKSSSGQPDAEGFLQFAHPV
jgi:RimJ/RimL family protein N-acetyltransferase